MSHVVVAADKFKGSLTAAEVAAHRVGAGTLEGRRRPVAASQRPHGAALREQAGHQRAADEPRSAGDEDLGHGRGRRAVPENTPANRAR